MTNLSKYKFLLMTVMLTILLISSAYAFLIPSVDAAELSLQDGTTISLPELDTTLSTVEEKGLTILSNVVGLDMESYEATSKERAQDYYMDVVPQENVRCTLQSNDSTVDMLCTFANGNLRKIYVLENEGTPHMTKSATKPLDLGNGTLQVVDLVETAKDFLSDYQGYSGNAFYGELRSMLENVDGDNNVTDVSGNVKLEVTVKEDSTVFKWIYSLNGMDAASKCVAIGYEDGFFKYFIDNWDLYKIGSTTVNISEEEAIDIAMDYAETFSWNTGSDNDTFEISGFTVANAMIWETVFCSNLYADEPRSDDSLMLYPVRHVWVSLDKFYPGNVYGFNVYVWADTGEVCAIQERFSTLDPPDDLVATTDDFTVEALSDQMSVDKVESNSLSVGWVALPAFASIMLGTVPVWFLLSKKRRIPKQGLLKICGVLLCFLIASILLLQISAVNAYDTRRALIWGSESAGAIDEDVPGDFDHWRKTETEVERQQIVCNALANYFEDDQSMMSITIREMIQQGP